MSEDGIMRSSILKRVRTTAVVVTVLLAGPMGGAIGHRADAASPGAKPSDNYELMGGALPVADGKPSAAELFAGLPDAGFAGYGNGTVFYSDAHLAGRERRTDVEAGFSSASFSSASATERRNELDRRVAPPLAAGEGFGRGSALDLGFNQEAGAVTDLLPQFNGEAEAKAPPSGKPVTAAQNDVNLEPIIAAQALKANASARAVPNACVLGSDLGFGLGGLVNASLVRAGEDADQGLLSTRGAKPPRGMSESVSRTRLVPVDGGEQGFFGLMAESRLTIAPITVLEGEQRMTIEVAGEWVLQAWTDGTTGHVVFGPDVEPGDDRPVLRILDAQNRPVNEVTLEEYVGSHGLVVEVPGLAEIILGEDPRAIGADQDSDPTASAGLVAGAADVLRVWALDETAADFAQLRVGHLEAAVAIPVGGLVCPGISVRKAIDRRAVAPGDKFSTTVTVTNPNDCILDDVTLTEAITATPGVRYKARAGGAKRHGDAPSTTLAFEHIGPLGRGESKDVHIEVKVDELSAPGQFRDVASAAGRCGRDTSVDDNSGGEAVAVAVTGRGELEGPEVTTVAGQVPDEPLATPPAPPPSGPTPAGTRASAMTNASSSRAAVANLPAVVSPATLKQATRGARSTPGSAVAVWAASARLNPARASGAPTPAAGDLARSGARLGRLPTAGGVLLLVGTGLWLAGRRRAEGCDARSRSAGGHRPGRRCPTEVYSPGDNGGRSARIEVHAAGRTSR
jgi:hypothetical protein